MEKTEKETLHGIRNLSFPFIGKGPLKKKKKELVYNDTVFLYISSTKILIIT